MTCQTWYLNLIRYDLILAFVQLSHNIDTDMTEITRRSASSMDVIIFSLEWFGGKIARNNYSNSFLDENINYENIPHAC